MSAAITLLVGAVLGWLVGILHGLDLADRWRVRAWRRDRNRRVR